MSLESHLAFCLAAALLIVVPGPSVMVVVAHSLGLGERRALFTIGGIATSHALFFAVTALGVAVALAELAPVFGAVKLAGAALLVGLGVRQWRGRAELLAAAPECDRSRSAASLFLQGFAVNTTNPKALVFYAAFFPPFLDPTAPAGPQLWTMGATFVVLLVGISFAYAAAAGRARRWLRDPARRRLQNRVTGGLLVGAGAALAAAPSR